MRKHITTGIRVSARRGEKLPLQHGQRRSKRQVWFGNVTGSVEGGSWKVTWDNGQITIEKSSQLQASRPLVTWYTLMVPVPYQPFSRGTSGGTLPSNEGQRHYLIGVFVCLLKIEGSR